MVNAIFRNLKQLIANAAPDSIYFNWVNLKNVIRKRPYRISRYDETRYRVDDGSDSIVIAQRTRHSRYKKGISAWVETLAGQYRMNQVNVTPGGVFIDCGANIGELGLWATKRGMVYHAFEPEQREASCCDINNFQGEPQTNQCGLWFETGEIKFYSKAGSADSSLIEIADYDEVFVVKTKTLDEYIKQQGINQIEVLKIEAEGAEPEVLSGSKEALKISRYVAVDCGRERGVDRQDTIRDVCNVLYNAGFRMIDSDMQRFTLLFERQVAAMLKVA